MIFFIAAILVILDQYSKFLITHRMAYGESIPVIKDIFHLTLISNTGIAFGLFKGGNTFFILTSLVIILGIIIFKERIITKHPLSGKVVIGLIVGGAIGNLIDRIRLRYVVDFLDFRVWPIFNLADSGITIGGITLFILLILNGKKRYAHRKEEDNFR